MVLTSWKSTLIYIFFLLHNFGAYLSEYVIVIQIDCSTGCSDYRITVIAVQDAQCNTEKSPQNWCEAFVCHILIFGDSP